MHTTFPVIAVNGIIDAQISPLDRGFAYGDGVFETCKVINSKIPLWDYHCERLLTSCKKLTIPVNIETIQHQIQHVFDSVAIELKKNAVIKIIVSRGKGGRGYASPIKVEPTIVIALFPPAEYPSHYFDQGVSVKLCHQRLSRNSSLAGLKHLNRLEQILARAEWTDQYFAEGLMLDTEHNIIEGIFSNIFIVKDKKLSTPDLSEAGVAGVMRRFILEILVNKMGIEAKTNIISLDDLINADEVFLCNSLYGIWPLRSLTAEQKHMFTVGPMSIALQAALNDEMINLSRT